MFLLRNTYFVRFSYTLNEKTLYWWEVFNIYLWKSPTERVGDIVNILKSDNATNIDLLTFKRV